MATQGRNGSCFLKIKSHGGRYPREHLKVFRHCSAFHPGQTPPLHFLTSFEGTLYERFKMLYNNDEDYGNEDEHQSVAPVSQGPRPMAPSASVEPRSLQSTIQGSTPSLAGSLAQQNINSTRASCETVRGKTRKVVMKERERPRKTTGKGQGGRRRRNPKEDRW